MGGSYDNPSYEDVCSGKTGHGEVVLIENEPKKVRYEKLLDLFWTLHDPTTKNRQGLNIGKQYRSAICFYSDEQEVKALESRQKEQKKHKNPIVTETTAAGKFWRAEEYHQKYVEKTGRKTC
jgi:peptide-methionine (S)-S-oxide reductase